MIELRYFADFYRTISMPDEGAVAIYRRDGMMLFRHPANEGALGAYMRNIQWFDAVAQAAAPMRRAPAVTP